MLWLNYLRGSSLVISFAVNSIHQYRLCVYIYMYICVCIRYVGLHKQYQNTWVMSVRWVYVPHGVMMSGILILGQGQNSDCCNRRSKEGCPRVSQPASTSEIISQCHITITSYSLTIAKALQSSSWIWCKSCPSLQELISICRCRRD